MTIMSASVRACLDTLNVVGRFLQHLGLRTMALDEHTILDDARRATGLNDFGPEEFRLGLRLLLQDYDREARLTALGRFVAHHDTVWLLAHRLQLEEARRRHPEIAEERIARPLFIVGLPRTGSTLLHHLLAQDPLNHVAQTWEVTTLPLTPDRRPRGTAARIRQAERDLGWLDRLVPTLKTIHPLGARLPIECLALTAHSFLSQRFHTMYRVPNYQEWLGRQELGPAYEFHRRFLQYLQWRAPASRWVLKAPSHAHGIDSLLEAYPDALVVQTHRDPVSVLASVASLTAVLRAAFSDRVDLSEIGDEVTRHWADGLDRLMQARGVQRLPAERVFDVYYHEFVDDPLATIHRLYAHFGIPFGPSAGWRVRRHLEDNPKDKHGPHTYSLATFGLDPEDLRHRFKAYSEHFGIPPEPELR